MSQSLYVMLNVVVLGVAMLSVVMPNVVAPARQIDRGWDRTIIVMNL